MNIGVVHRRGPGVPGQVDCPTPGISWAVDEAVVESAVTDLGDRLAVPTAANEIRVYSARFGEFVTRLLLTPP